MKNPFLENFRPYIPDSANLRELTPFPLIIGSLLGIIFGASSLYLVLKTGLTVSASIPVAVIAITVFRLLSKVGMRDATILEANMLQTAGSAGESIAFGIGVTMPAIMILGFELELTRVMLVGVMGGLLGILMMIPLRRALIKDQHGILKYPEGTACAQVLIAGASKESRDASHEGDTHGDDSAALQGGKIITVGFIIGFLFNALMKVLFFWKESPGYDFTKKGFNGGSINSDNDPTLLGVGYIIGPRIAGLMMGGGVLSYLVLIPAIKFFGSSATGPIAPEISKTIADMGPNDVRGAYVLYIGAGAVAMAGIISLVRSLPTILHGLKGGLADLRGSKDAKSNLPRTDQDLSMKWVIVGVIALIAAIMLFPQLGLSVFANPLVSFGGAILIIILGFLFVTVSSRLTGEVGSSSNPISGMTVATLLITCSVFLALGWTNPDPYFVTALSIGGIVCIAASNGGTTSQDLKTGFWVGGTPWRQQIAILVGALASALVLGSLLIMLNNNETYFQKIDASNPVFSKVLTEDRLFKQNGQLQQEKVSNGKYMETDTNTYRVWQNTEPTEGQVGKYLVDQNGRPVYFVDPGINGILKKDDEGNDLTRYDAPKATLMSYIIKGVLGQNLPWGLVILGAMIAVVLELAGVPSLAFAVGIYLPISTSSPIFIGGIVRYLVDIYLKRKLKAQNLTEDEIMAETDKSNGVLLASGYIAGGAIAGILIALFAVQPSLKAIQDTAEHWAKGSNPFLSSDLLGILPFVVLAVVLYLVGREIWLSGRKRAM
jgi:putative OPT family oligopeptide transporter